MKNNNFCKLIIYDMHFMVNKKIKIAKFLTFCIVRTNQIEFLCNLLRLPKKDKGKRKVLRNVQNTGRLHNSIVTNTHNFYLFIWFLYG